MKWHKVVFYTRDGDLTGQAIAFMNKHKLKPGELLVIREIPAGLQSFPIELEASYYNDIELEK
jgi:ribosomal protein L2